MKLKKYRYIYIGKRLDAKDMPRPAFKDHKGAVILLPARGYHVIGFTYIVERSSEGFNIPKRGFEDAPETKQYKVSEKDMNDWHIKDEIATAYRENALIRKGLAKEKKGLLTLLDPLCKYYQELALKGEREKTAALELVILKYLKTWRNK